MTSQRQEWVEAGAKALQSQHWDGKGCNLPPDHPNACVHCYGPSPMSEWEVVGAALKILEPLIRADERSSRDA